MKSLLDLGRPWLAIGCASALWAASSSPTPTPPRGYSLPLIDLAAETHRQVVVDREPGQYLGHPTTCLLEDGRTILCVYPKGHGRGALVYKRSTDGGRTWSERLPTPPSWATSKEVPTLHRLVDPDGRKRLILWSGLQPARRAVSEDDGSTWSELEPVGDWGGVVVMASVEPLATGSGHYLAMFHDDGRFIAPQPQVQQPVVFTLYQTRSRDGGLTWSAPEPIGARADVHLCEPGVIRSPDGRQLAALLRENSRRRNSYIIFSDDEARTWTAPRELPGALTGDRHTGKYAPDGRLFISFRDTTHDSTTRGDWVAWVGTYDDLTQGREGQYRVRLMDNHHAADCAYPGVELLPNGTFVTTTYGHWTPGQSPYIVSVHLELAELDERAARRPPTPGEPAQTEVFVSGQAGYHTFRIPSAILTARKTLLAFAEGRKTGRSDTGDIDLVLRRSTDRGATWDPLQIVWDDAGNTCGNPCPVLDRDTGTVWLLLTWNRGDDTERRIIDQTSHDTRRVFVTHSTDDGLSWATPREITSAVKLSSWTWYATGPGAGIQLEHGPHRGRLIVPCDHIEAETKDYYSHAIYSDDHGQSWRLGGSSPRPQVNECEVAELPGQRLLLNMRNYDRSQRTRQTAMSRDGGLSWTDQQHAPALIEPICQASLRRHSWADGDRPGVLLFSNPASAQREKLTVRASYDDGQTWPVARELHPGPAAYSCLVVLPDRTVGCLYERGVQHPYETIRWTRFTLDWLTSAR
ncbi:MAG: exo-alpha-sialidase [Verrucomicrobia bacterium]|nr:exo-alpha-sialidase [Verrucomicrobiota bacterium]